MFSKKFLIVSFLVIGMIFPASFYLGSNSAWAATLIVPDDFPGIQQAIDAAESGDTILVNPGVYVDGINFGGKDLLIQSTNGPELTTIDGNGGTGVQIGPNGALTGFSITNSIAAFGAGMIVIGNGSIISNNIFDGNIQTAGGFGAAIGGNSASPSIEQNVFRNNTCDNQWLSGVVSFVNSSSPRIINNIFENNPCRGINMTLPVGNTPEIINNTIINNRTGVRVDRRANTSLQIYRNNIIVGNEIGLEVDFGTETNNPTWENNLVYDNNIDYDGISDQTDFNGNISVEPMFVNLEFGDYHLQVSSPCIDTGTNEEAPDTDFEGEIRPQGNGYDIGADEFADSDGDNIPDYQDAFPNDPNEWLDSDDDGVGDNSDNCPDISNPSQIDSDVDGVGDVCDNCPNDPDNDADGDGICGDVDLCPNDPDNDADNDGVCGDVDGCPNDTNKIEPGICGCGVPDIDSDNDGTPDCNDNCPNDEDKIEPGVCGCSRPDTDVDNDGILDCVEDDGPNGGDGNGDFIPDSQQPHVTSLETYDGQSYVTMESSGGTTITNCQAVSNPSPGDAPADVDFPFGFFSFTISGVPANGAISVILDLHGGTEPDTYWKYGFTPGNLTNHWYEFLYDGNTGAEINGTEVTLNFVNGDRGDDDLDGNNTLVVDVGGPGSPSSPVGGGGGGGGGGGCFIATAAYGS